MRHPAGSGAAGPAREVIAVASGKGGVGKSTVSLNVALALAETGASVGLMDADLYAPDIPRMVNLARHRPLKHLTLWSAEAEQLEPLERHGIRLMSAGFLLAEDQSLTLGSGLVDLLLQRFVHGVAWGDLDHLVIDLPPGTADLQQQMIRRVRVSGVLVVVTPQDVAHLDAKKVVEMYRRAGVPVLGGVENMSGLRCPDCDRRIDVLPRVAEDRSIWAMGVRRLGTIPLDPALASAGDAGVPVAVSDPDSQQSYAFRLIAGAVTEALASL